MASTSRERSVRPGDRAVVERFPDLLGHVPGSVLGSTWVARVDRVSFLGALETSPGCRERGSRLEHSAGVARLALRAARSARLEGDALRTLVTAAFLHDVGHWPFSHSAEAAFRDALGLDHHALTRCIVLGEEPVEQARSLAPALEGAGLDPAAVWSLLDGGATLSPLLLGSVNVDTLEGIPRAARAFGLRTVALPAKVFDLRGGEAWIRRDAVDAIDRFWRLKDRVYRKIINAPALAALDLRFCADAASVIDARMALRLDALDDADLAGRMGARSLPTSCRYSAAADARTAPVRILRTYDVDESVRPGPGGLAAEAWGRRWRQRRERWFLVSDDPALQLDLPMLRETETAEL